VQTNYQFTPACRVVVTAALILRPSEATLESPTHQARMADRQASYILALILGVLPEVPVAAGAPAPAEQLLRTKYLFTSATRLATIVAL
jgi:hypothetical protein